MQKFVCFITIALFISKTSNAQTTQVAKEWIQTEIYVDEEESGIGRDAIVMASNGTLLLRAKDGTGEKTVGTWVRSGKQITMKSNRGPDEVYAILEESSTQLALEMKTNYGKLKLIFTSK